MEAINIINLSGKGRISSSTEYRAHLIRLLDVLFILLSLLASHWLRFENLTFSSNELIITVLFTGCYAWVATFLGFYKHTTNQSLEKLVWLAIYSYIVTVSIASVLLTLTHTAETFSRIWFLVGGTLSIALIIGCRVFLIKAIKNGWVKFPVRRVVIVGAGDIGIELSKRLAADHFKASEIVGFFSDDESATAGLVQPLLGKLEDVEDKLEKLRSDGNPIEQIFVALPATEIRREIEFIRRLTATQYHTFVVPDYSLSLLFNSRSDDVSGLPVIDLSHSPLQGFKATTKTLLDLILSAIGLVLLTPLMLVVAVLIKLESPGPILFSQRRYGVGGKEILVHKFRTMTVTEDGENIKQATPNDIRITRVGKILRSTSIDELPQLLNVLSGNMSLVGPRPHAVAHNEMYRKLIGGYMKRHSIKPGITGLAQVSGCRGETQTVDDMQRRVDFDREYLKTWSIKLDLLIILKTIYQVLRGEQAY